MYFLCLQLAALQEKQNVNKNVKVNGNLRLQNLNGWEMAKKSESIISPVVAAAIKKKKKQLQWSDLGLCMMMC